MKVAFLTSPLERRVAFQEAGDPVGVARHSRLPGLGPQDQPVDAQRGVALHLSRVDRLERHRRDLEHAQPAGLSTSSAARRNPSRSPAMSSGVPLP